MIKKSLAAALLLSSALTVQAGERLTLLTENYPPFNMSVDDRNFARGIEVEGISTDIIREMVKRANIEATFTLRFPWSRIYNQTLKKPNYAIFSTARSAEREPLFQWVGPVVDNDYVLFTMAKSNLTINTIEDLKKYKVGAYKDDYVSQLLKSKGIEVIETPEDSYNATKLEQGRIDVWASGSLSGPYNAGKVGVTNIKQIYVVESKGLHLAFNKQTPVNVIKKLQTTLDAIKADGTAAAIHKRYQ
ncbi:substrate-binding periplasmic protein [Parendozoicomonas haliclonae]|nr:ABC transporter substrate-binding protein [Parendozoicomonas haliclonae]